MLACNSHHIGYAYQALMPVSRNRPSLHAHWLSHMAHGCKTRTPLELTLVLWFPTLVVVPRIRRVVAERPKGVVRFLACTDMWFQAQDPWHA